MNWRSTWTHWGLLAIILPYIVIGLMVPEAYKAMPIYSEAHQSMTGDVHLEVHRRRGGNHIYVVLKTPNPVVLNCSIPPWVECYPGAWSHDGQEIVAVMSKTQNGQLRLRQVIKDGKTLADESFFDNRLQTRRKFGWAFIALSNMFGLVLLATSQFSFKRKD